MAGVLGIFNPDPHLLDPLLLRPLLVLETLCPERDAGDSLGLHLPLHEAAPLLLDSLLSHRFAGLAGGVGPDQPAVVDVQIVDVYLLLVLVPLRLMGELADLRAGQCLCLLGVAGGGEGAWVCGVGGLLFAGERVGPLCAHDLNMIVIGIGG
jgi:hypothetical protein